MKTPEILAKELFGFTYIDDIEPQSICLVGNSSLLEIIEKIQKDSTEKLNIANNNSRTV